MDCTVHSPFHDAIYASITIENKTIVAFDEYETGFIFNFVFGKARLLIQKRVKFKKFVFPCKIC